LREHWAKRSKRHKAQRNWIEYFWQVDNPKIEVPCKIKLVRISPRKLDYDNLVGGALKFTRDVIADLILPGKAKGRADGDDRLFWEYGQTKGSMALEVIIYCDK
jgi:hypothetical protein